MWIRFADAKTGNEVKDQIQQGLGETMVKCEFYSESNEKCLEGFKPKDNRSSYCLDYIYWRVENGLQE